MKILNRLTVKHLKLNKKRTIVTIIGITLSMALMLGFGLLFSSFVDAMRKDAINNYGTYHAVFEDTDYDDSIKISKNVNVATSYYYSSIGFAMLENPQNEYKPYLFFAGADEALLKKQTLVEGRLPENDTEVVIPQHLLYNGGAKYKVGDTLDLDIGSRVQDGVTDEIYRNESFDSLLNDRVSKSQHKTYKIVGIIERSKVEPYDAAGYTVFTKTTDYSKDKPNYVYVEYKNVAKSYQYSDDIETTLKLESSVNYNSGLLYYYGTTRYNNINNSIAMVLAIVLSLLSIGCIVVIYNSFAISTMERKKQFGLYSSIGATRKQIMHTVFFEALVVGVVGIVLGIIGSFLGIYIVLQILNYLLSSVWGFHFVLTIEPLFVIIPIVFMIVVIFLSAYIPAKRASRVTPIEAIRENDDIKLPKRKLKTGKWVTKLFGIEGELALKNMKRNKKKYRITILSLFISIVLFISFSTYLNYGIDTTDSFETVKYDILVSTKNNSTDNEALLKELAQNSKVESYDILGTAYLNILSPSADYFHPKYREYIEVMYGELPKNNSVNFFVLSDDEFLEYANSLSKGKDDVLFINSGQYTFYEQNNRKTFETKLFQKELQELKWCVIKDNPKDDDIFQCDYSIPNVTFTETTPKGLEYLKRQDGFSAIISKSQFEHILSQHQNKESGIGNISYELHVYTKDYQSLFKEWSLELKNQPLNVFSPAIEKESENNVILAIKILLYGFISLVTLIGVTSVFNTIHTSINLRRKEFAMLRSMGLTPKGFNKMILFESLFFGLKSLLYGLPVSAVFIFLIHSSMSGFIIKETVLIPWGAILVAIIGVFIIVLLSMSYSVNKIRKENILEAIRDENI